MKRKDKGEEEEEEEEEEDEWEIKRRAQRAKHPWTSQGPRCLANLPGIAGSGHPAALPPHREGVHPASGRPSSPFRAYTLPHRTPRCSYIRPVHAA